MKRALLIAGLFLLPRLAAAGPEIIPVVNFELYGGKTNFDGDDSSFGGNGSISVAPVFKFSDDAAIIPSYSGMVQRTVQAQELIGGALLTQSEQQHLVNVKGIRRLGESPWKGKTHVSYKKELLRETTDESWGDGLFDYNKYAAGFEFERNGERVQSFRTSLDVFVLRYPNFSSLSSQEFGSEIGSGTDVLDLNAVDVLNNVDMSLWKGGIMSANLLVSPRFYTDAHVIDESGEFQDAKRRDVYVWNGYSLHQKFKAINQRKLDLRTSAGFQAALAVNSSNQNGYDADATRFNENYYSYSEWQAGPQFAAAFLGRWEVGLGYSFIQRLYADRPVLSQTGDYTAGKVRTETQVYSSRLSYRLLKGFSISSSFSYLIAKSNQKYEQTYKYNYDSSSFFIGLNYAN